MTTTSSFDTSLRELADLGNELDQVAVRLESGREDEALSEMAVGLEEAESRIAQLVADAESRRLLADPTLASVKAEWLARFERFFGFIDQARREIDVEADLRLSRHRAANAYLKNQRAP